MSRMTCRNGFVFVTAICLGLMVTSARGGSLDDIGAPTDPASAMYTAKDLYDRLMSGTNAPKRAGAFTEPTAGPTAGTMPTTDDIMAQAPAINVDGAVDGAVLSGKTFWGLTQGAWGTRTGTIATVTLSPANDTVSNGYYAATTLHAVDADLATNNIRSGVTIFGFAGDSNVVNTSTGNARAGDVKSGQVAWVQGTAITGTIETVTLSGTTTNMAAGYYAATNLAQVATNLAAGNLVKDIDIFGVTGTAITATGDAVVADVLASKTFSKSGASGLTGTMANQAARGFMPGTANVTIPAGYYNGSGVVTGDAALTAGNIATNVTIFGIAGTANTNAGSTYPAMAPKTGQTNSYANYDDGWYSTNKGVAWPNPRFSPVAETGAETNQVRDNLTGLIWARDANFASGTKNWQEALDYITATNASATLYGGTNDWRLPNVRELQSLVAYQYHTPALSDGTGTNKWTEALGPFTGALSAAYWSSTTYAEETVQAWYVNLNDVDVNHCNKVGEPHYVWPVRGP